MDHKKKFIFISSKKLSLITLIICIFTKIIFYILLKYINFRILEIIYSYKKSYLSIYLFIYNSISLY